MRRKNDVFFFTLIDLFVQALFFGVLVFVVSKHRSLEQERSTQASARRAADELDTLKAKLAAAGISNLAELDDQLSRMVPVDKCVPLEEAKGEREFIATQGGIERVKELAALVEKAGGPESLEDKLRQFEKAYGAPPCEKRVDKSGRIVPISIATLRIMDDAIEFEEAVPSEALEALLSRLGASYAEVRRGSVKDFEQRFPGMRVTGPDKCRHFVKLRICTELLRPVDAVHAVFRPAGRVRGC